MQRIARWRNPASRIQVTGVLVKGRRCHYPRRHAEYNFILGIEDSSSVVP